MIRVSHLSKTFEDHVVLNDLSFDVAEGEIVAILGESGTGKSVLLKHLMGLMRPDEGVVTIDSQDITNFTENDLLKLRQRIGYLFQEGALYDFMSVFENIAFPLKEHNMLDKNAIQEKVKKALELVDLQGEEEKMPSELSGGMKKRVGLARAIIMDSKILFCDEPTTGLDPIHSRDIMDLISQISRKLHCTTLITSHDIPNSFRIADRLILLKDGKIAAMGAPKDIQECQNVFVKEFISA